MTLSEDKIAVVAIKRQRDPPGAACSGQHAAVAHTRRILDDRGDIKAGRAQQDNARHRNVLVGEESVTGGTTGHRVRVAAFAPRAPRRSATQSAA